MKYLETKASFNVASGLVAAIFFVFICVLIRPAGLAANDGISYFGSFRTTIVPYSLAFFLDAFYYWEAANNLGSKNKVNKLFGYGLRLMAVLLIGLLVTPHTLLDGIHITIGATLFSFQLLLSIWLVIGRRFNWPNLSLVLVELLSGLACLYYLPKADGLLLQGQVVFQIAFGTLLIRFLNKHR